MLGLRQPVRLLLSRMISSAVRPPIPAGTQPENLLLATTSTETGDLSSVNGIEVAKRLLLMNRASKSFKKRSVGKSPSNSLKRMSKNFSIGSDRTTVGKPPTNLLLLRSSSKSSFSFEKLRGTTPQKRLELR